MVEIGTVLPCVVVRVENFGVFLEHETDRVFVHLPEVSWQVKGPFPSWIRPGETHDVLVIGYNYVKHEIIGSLRRLHPEENPWRDLSRLDPGTVLQGKVSSNWGEEITVALPNGAWGSMPKYAMLRVPDVDEEIDVVIFSLWVDDGLARLEPAQPSDRGPACQIQVQIPQLVA